MWLVLIAHCSKKTRENKISIPPLLVTRNRKKNQRFSGLGSSPDGDYCEIFIAGSKRSALGGGYPMPIKDFTRMIDAERGIVDRTIFSDPAIYELELERIFARSWLFPAPKGQLRIPGDYFSINGGPAPVLFGPQRVVSLKAFLTSS